METNFIDLYTKRLRIRDHVKEDAPTHHKLLSDPEVMYYLQDVRTGTRAASLQNLQEAISEIEKPDRQKFYLRIEDKEKGTHIGEVGYTVTGYAGEGKIVQAGYFIRKEFWNKGYVTEAMEAVLSFAFTRGGVAVVMTGCLKENRASERVMQKCGMIKEQDCCLKEWYDGRLKERVLYRLPKQEWMKGQSGARETLPLFPS